MSSYDIYILILCLIVFALLTTLSIVCIYLICKMYLRLVKVGAEDDKLIEEDRKLKLKKCSTASKIFDYVLTFVLVAAFALVFTGSLYINCTQNVYFSDVPTYRVVMTGSMAKVHEKNSYLNDLGIDDQIQTFDLIATYKIPEEKDLKLYDIVVYEVDEMLIIHRIVGIEEPNEKHPDERYFLLQGDAVEAPDRFPVKYEQMKGIYRGDKVPFIGSFVLFMQSPAGWLCMLLVVVAVIATPILEKKIEKAKHARLELIGVGEEKIAEGKKGISKPKKEREKESQK